MISAILLGILLGPPHAFTKTHVHSWAPPQPDGLARPGPEFGITRGLSNARRQDDECGIECIRMHRLRVDTLVPICVSTKDEMACSVFSFSPLGGDKNTCIFWYDSTGQRWLKMQSISQRGPKNYFQDLSGLLIERPTHQGRLDLDTGGGKFN